MMSSIAESVSKLSFGTALRDNSRRLAASRMRDVWSNCGGKIAVVRLRGRRVRRVMSGVRRIVRLSIELREDVFVLQSNFETWTLQ